jgi:hypothetical protein
MAYRLDSGRRENMRRRIGLCELDGHLNVIPGSALPLSETIKGGDPHHYDPRFLIYRDRLFIHYNNNYMTRPNQIFLVELDPDSLEARSPARPLDLVGPRKEIEKNWMLFEHDGDLYGVYQICPHAILSVDIRGTGPVTCSPSHITYWDATAYSARYGAPCGGAPPLRQENEYTSFFHSRIQVGFLRPLPHRWLEALIRVVPRYPAAALRRVHWLLDQRRYFGGVYTFSATPPFAPRRLAAEPMLRPEWEQPRTQRRRISPNAESVVYPCGSVKDLDGSWLVSYGVHDERCCLRRVVLPMSSA